MTISKVDLDILEGGNYKSIIKKILKKPMPLEINYKVY